MLIVDGHGTVRAWSEWLARLLGRGVDQLAWQPVCALLPGWSPFDPTGLECGLRLAALHTSVPVRVSCEALHLPNDTFYLLDVHRLPRGAEPEPGLPESIMVTDRRGEIRYVNRVFEATTGFSAAEVAGLTPAILKSGAHPRRTYRELWDTILDGRVYRGVLINRRKNGEHYHEDKIIRPVLDADGHPSLFVSSGRDVTASVHKAMPSEACAAL